MKKVVKLRTFRGTEILKKEDGSYKNENSLVSLVYDTLEWNNFLKNIKANPYCKIDVEKVFENVDGKYNEIEIPENIVKEVEKAHKGEQEVKLTPEQVEIAELKAQMAQLLGKTKVVKVDAKDDVLELKKEDVFTGTEPLDNLRNKYLEKYKKEVPNNKKNDEEWIKSKLTK